MTKVKATTPFLSRKSIPKIDEVSTTDALTKSRDQKDGGYNTEKESDV